MLNEISYQLSIKTVIALFTFRVAPRPTGDSPVAACRAQQTMISIKLVSCLSSSAENGEKFIYTQIENRLIPNCEKNRQTQISTPPPQKGLIKKQS